MGKVYIIYTDRQSESFDYDKCPTLEEMQGWVGGLIERLPEQYWKTNAPTVKGEPLNEVIVNEEGIFKCERNVPAEMFLGHVPIFGPAILLVGVELR